MATIRDVAREAGVSIGTVSRYLNGVTLKKNNMKNIKLAIEKLNYKENMIAKGLKNNRSLSIGVVINSLTDVFATSIVTSLESYLEEHNYSIMICDYQNDLKKLKRKLEFLKNRSIDGLILFHVEDRIPILDEFKEEGTPIILIDCPIEGFDTDVFLVDNRNASRKVTEFLLEQKHTKIAIIAGDQKNYIGRERLKGFIDAIKSKELDISKEYIKFGDYTKESGYRLSKELLELDNRPTAIYSTNYYMTLGTIQAIYEKKLNIPEDISIVGFDSFEMSNIFEPKLTTIRQPVEEIGRKAGELILRRIKEETDEDESVRIIKTEILWNNSVSICKEKIIKKF